jgi:hypothetical protein
MRLTTKRLALAAGIAAAVLGLSASVWAKTQYELKRSPRVKSQATRVHDGLQAGTLAVKFIDDSRIYDDAGRLYFSDGRPVAIVNRLIDRGVVLRAEPLVSMDKSQLLDWRRNGEARAQMSLADLTSYFRLVLAPGQTTADAARIADALNRADYVELAFLQGKPEVAVDIPPPTPNYEGLQTYLNVAPGGVDAYAAWSYPGGKGETVTICDIEFGWQVGHEDLSALTGGHIGGAVAKDDHGTAVMGEMVGDSTTYGITGICYEANARMVSVALYSTENALLLAAANLTVGDLILIELHQPGPNSTGSGQFGYVPMEWTPSIFDIIQVISANGLIVCEAAGNGSQNLDDPVYAGWFNPNNQHSGAIMCGAGAPPSGAFGPDRSRLSFSNYGQRVDLQGYGQGVVTTGYGGLFTGGGDTLQYYTSTFNGTSSASPIVTGSVACIQGRFKNVSGGYTMTAQEIRDVLYATGSPQTTNISQHIGPRPDLGGAMLLIAPLSAYANPRSFNVSLLNPPIVTDTLWLVNPHSNPTSFSITVVDSLPVMPAASGGSEKDALLARNLAAAAAAFVPNWIIVSPLSGSVPASDSVPVEVTFDGSVLPASYFGNYFKGRLDVETVGDDGTDTLPVPILALAQDSLHGDTIQVVTAELNHTASSETNMKGWKYNDSTTSSWMYDASFLVGRRTGGDTTVYRDIFGNARNWRGRDFWQSDSSFPGYVMWRDSSMTEDSLLGLRYEAWVPVTGDSAEFVLWRMGLYARAASLDLVTFGVVADWDLPSTSGSDNLGAFDTTRQMIYQTGNGGFTNNAAGFAYIRGATAKAHGAVVGNNETDVYPTGGFTDTKLYSQMITAGFRTDASNVDLHTMLTPYFSSSSPVPTDSALPFDVVVLSSRTGVGGLNESYARAKKLSDTLRYIACPIAMTGDVNESGAVNSADIIFLVNYVFKGGGDPQPIVLAGNVDCTGAVTSADIIYLVNFVFKSGASPCDACTIY